MYAVSRMLTETTVDSVRNERLTGQTRLISSCNNVKDDLESLLEQIGFSSFLSLSRELSPFLHHEHVLSLLILKLLLVSLNSLYKFHVSCFVFSHFNSRPPLSLLLHFNCSLPGDVLWGSFVTHSGGEVNA